jgi:hypothetical protein
MVIWPERIVTGDSRRALRVLTKVLRSLAASDVASSLSNAVTSISSFSRVHNDSLPLLRDLKQFHINQRAGIHACVLGTT